MSLTRKAERELVDLRSKVNYETANFDGIAEHIELIRKGNSTFIRWTPHFSSEPIESTITEFIIERTRLYRDSWINPIIDSLLEKK